VEAVCILSERGLSGEEGLRVVIETTEPIGEARLREVAEAHLNRFPHAYFHLVERLPRNHMGKVERLKLTQLLLDLQRPDGGAPLSENPVNPAS
jgi:acyl-coenzyme A synthetase/AMP-(fatty) acid ligase